MNIPILIAGIIAALAMLGHFTMGMKLFLKPMLDADFDIVPKKTIHSVFHYVSVFQLLSAFFLIMIGIRGSGCMHDPTLLLVFIGLCYALWAIWQFVIILRSSVKGGFFKMFQWIFWIIIAVLIYFGISF